MKTLSKAAQFELLWDETSDYSNPGWVLRKTTDPRDVEEGLGVDYPLTGAAGSRRKAGYDALRAEALAAVARKDGYPDRADVIAIGRAVAARER